MATGRIENLKPWTKGQSGNLKGRPKGVRNLSTLIQQLLADEELMDKIAKSKPGYWDQLPAKNAANAIVAAMMIKALSGEIAAANWLSKYGFGDKVDITSDGERLEMTPVIVSDIVPREINDDAETEAETTPDNTTN